MSLCIGCKMEFEAAHKLPEEEIYGDCSNLHGHRYELTVEISGQINEKGWIVNFSDVKKIIRDKVIKKLDHSYLNDFFTIPTAENVVLFILNSIQEDILELGCEVEYIKLFETRKNYAIWRKSMLINEGENKCK